MARVSPAALAEQAYLPDDCIEDKSRLMSTPFLRSLLARAKRPPWRTLILLLAVLGILAIGYVLWSPGATVIDGRHDLRKNAIWIQHGWLGDDAWFDRNGRDTRLFRDSARIAQLAATLESHGIRYVYPHACPARPDGGLPPIDDEQTERFLDTFAGFSVIPWIGGTFPDDCPLENMAWRGRFVSSVRGLLDRHPRLAGVHVNIEPMPSGNRDFIALLQELRQGLPGGKVLSVAAYPPPTRWHRFPEVHWEEPYFRQVAAEVDQLAVMMYDTSIRLPKVYQHVMKSWTTEVLQWAPGAEVLLGVPAYDDAGSGYHHPSVENLANAIPGVHAGLASFPQLPPNYSGIAIYCEWEMDKHEWRTLEQIFGRGK
jgi:hypothetical protein